MGRGAEIPRIFCLRAGGACAEPVGRLDSSFSHKIVIIPNKVCRILILVLTRQRKGVK